MLRKPPVHRAPHQKGEAHRLLLWRKFARFNQGKRPSAGDRGYGKDWQQLRAAHLAAEPYCRLCAEEGVTRAAALVDHIESITKRPDLRLDDANLQSLCWPCHRAKTNRYDGGFGNAKRAVPRR